MKWLNFLDRWETGIFKSYNENHEPVSLFVATVVLCSSFAMIVTVFIMQMASAKDATISVVSGIIVGCSFLIMVWKSYRPLIAFSTTGTKIGFAAYILLIFGILTTIFIALATIVLIIAMGLFLLWIALTVMGGSDSKGPSRAYYSDGSSEKLEEDGRGPTGERFYKGKDTGNQFVDP